MRNSNANSVHFFASASRFLSLAAAMVLTAHAEHELAVAIGINEVLAWLFPVCLDLYAAAAFRAHARRDIGAAIGLMIGCQTLAHLIDAAMITPAWWLIIPVSAVVPIVLWRGHHLGTSPQPAVDSVPEVPAPGSVAPIAEPISRPVTSARTAHPVPWPSHRTEPTLTEIAAPVASLASLAPVPTVETTTAPNPARRKPRKNRDERLAELRELVTARPSVNQAAAARHMGVSDRYVRNLFSGTWDNYRAEVLATA